MALDEKSLACGRSDDRESLAERLNGRVRELTGMMRGVDQRLELVTQILIGLPIEKPSETKKPKPAACGWLDTLVEQVDSNLEVATRLEDNLCRLERELLTSDSSSCPPQISR